MFPDVPLRFHRKSAAFLRIFIKLLYKPCEFLRRIANPHHPFRFRDPLGADGGGHDRGTIVNGLHDFSLHAGAVAQGNHHKTAGGIQLCQLLFGYKAFYDNSRLRVVQGLNLLGHLGAHNIKVHRAVIPDQGEYLLREPQHRVRVGRMGEASYKQESLPLGEILVDLLQKRLIYIGGNGLQTEFRPQLMDRVHFHVRRIVGHRRLLH